MSLLHAAPEVLSERNITRDLLEILVGFDLVFDSLTQENETAALRIGERIYPGLCRFRFDSRGFDVTLTDALSILQVSLITQAVPLLNRFIREIILKGPLRGPFDLTKHLRFVLCF